MRKNSENTTKTAKNTKITKKCDLKGARSPQKVAVTSRSSKPAKVAHKRTDEVDFSKKQNLNTKIEKIKARQAKAIELKQKLDKTYKEYTTFLNKAEKLETKQNTPAKRQAFDKFFKEENALFAEKEDDAYRKYYNHMHKDFNNIENHPAVDFTKYKDKFLDEKFIKDIYKDKIKSVKKGSLCK